MYCYDGSLFLASILAFVDISHARATRHILTHGSWCREPEIAYHCLDIDVDEPHDSFLMKEGHITQAYDVQEYVNIYRISTARTTDSHQCKWQRGQRYNSTCPHHYVINHDKNRRPKTLLEAKCNCNENMPCLDGLAGSRCEPVKYFLTVLRKNGCHNGSYTYTKSIESITVGCTCAYRRSGENMRTHIAMEE